MPRTPARFTQAEIERLIRAAKACDVPVEGVGIDEEGNFRTFPNEPQRATLTPEDKLAEWERRNGHHAA